MTNIDEYIAAYDGEIKERMIALRALIHSCHPDITEKIAWGIPTFVLKGNPVHFSAEKCTRLPFSTKVGIPQAIFSVISG